MTTNDKQIQQNYLEYGNNKQKLSNFQGTYPRAIQLDNGDLVATFDSWDNQQKLIRVSRYYQTNKTWYDVGVVVTASLDDDLGNGHPIQIKNSSTLLCAYRHHQKINGLIVYRLLLSKSEDYGKNWKSLSQISISKTQGVGLWEPYLFMNPVSNKLEVYYAKERSDKMQDIVKRVSDDYGMDWGIERVVASRGDSRDGMPSVTVYNGMIITIFESWRNHLSPPMKVECIISKDGGLTWDNRQNVYEPDNPIRNAGAPYIITYGDKLIASFMTDENSQLKPDWPNQAMVKTLQGKLSNFIANTILWSNPANVDFLVFWPSLLSTTSQYFVLYEQNASIYYQQFQ